MEESAAEEAARGRTSRSLSAEPEPLEVAGFPVRKPRVSALLRKRHPTWSPGWSFRRAAPCRNGRLRMASLSACPPRTCWRSTCGLTLPPSKRRYFTADLSPQAFAGAQPDPALSSVATAPEDGEHKSIARRRCDRHRHSAHAQWPRDADESLAAIHWHLRAPSCWTILELLELPPTDIDFPAEDSDVSVLARSQFEAHPHSTRARKRPEAPVAEDHSPRASLEALSRLHQELVEQEAARVPEAPVEPQPPTRDPPTVEVPVEVAEAVEP